MRRRPGVFGRIAFIVCTGIVAAPCGSAQITGLEPGVAITRQIGPDETHQYPLELPEDVMVRMLIVERLPFEVVVTLVGPDGRITAERTSRQNIFFSCRAQTAGRYVLRISSPKASPGLETYSISNIEVRPFKLVDEALLQADADYSALRRRSAPSARDAARKLDAAADVYAKLDQPDFEGWTLLVGGQYWVRLSDYKQAADHYARSATAFEKSANRFGRANALDFLGDISAVLRDFPKAIEAATEELSIARQYRLRELEAGALSILGRAYSRQGEKQRALELFEQAYAAAHSAGDQQREAAALMNAATLHTSLGNYQKGLVSYQEALAIQRARGSRLDEAASLSNIGSVYASMGELSKAIDSLQQAIALFRSTDGGRPALATTLSDCGQAYLAAGQPDKAAPLLEEALAIAREKRDRWAEAYTLTNLGKTRHATRDLDGAAELFRSALQIQLELGDAQVEAVTRFETARLERDRGNLAAARNQAAAAIDLAEGLRDKVAVPDLRSAFLASVKEYYDLHVDTLMALHKQSASPARLEEARQAAERGRARNLLDVLAAAGVPTSRDSEIASREQKLHHDLDELSNRRSALLRVKSPARELAAIDAQIDATWLDYQSIWAKTRSFPDRVALNAGAIQRDALDSNTALLEYSLGEPRSYLWTISADEIRGFELPGRAQIEQASREFWDTLKAGLDQADVTRAAARLSQIALGPAQSVLGHERLVVVADGALQYVPFAALSDPRQKSGYHPLILDHEIVYEPSASILAMMRHAQIRREKAQRGLAIFADPVFESSDPRLRRGAISTDATPQAFLTRAAELGLARLPATRAEGRSIAALLPDKDRWLALDFDASREAVTSSRLGEYRVVHFATHGVIESSRPELSALAFSLFDAQGKPQDGFLRLYEIYNMNIRADLVVLSACQTALGKNVRGEGLVGLARGFMHAGVPRVVASLWKVDDQATSELMRLFYTAMLGPQHKSAAAALRAAQIAVARQEGRRSPYYWAAFVLQGEWR
jgi:CHAT domain-containing protein/Tfp pilus assembly protein PilF